MLPYFQSVFNYFVLNHINLKDIELCVATPETPSNFTPPPGTPHGSNSVDTTCVGFSKIVISHINDNH